MVDPYEAELAEQAASGGSGSTLGGGFNLVVVAAAVIYPLAAMTAVTVMSPEKESA